MGIPRIDQLIRMQEGLNRIDRPGIEAMQLHKLNALLKKEKQRGGFYRALPDRLENLSERLPSFYLATPSTEDESKYKSKKKYFEQLGIQVVEFDDYASLYDAPEWKKLAR